MQHFLERQRSNDDEGNVEEAEDEEVNLDSDRNIGPIYGSSSMKENIK